MLKKLYVRNYALIDELEISFSERFNIITGETGAGKSILLGALSLILGQRANTAAMPNNDEKCVVEGTFDVATYQLKPFFTANDIDYDDETVIRREITASGKSRAFINDTPVNLSILKDLSEQLVSLHAQHQTLHLYDAQFHLFIIDSLAGHHDLLAQYRQLFGQFRQSYARLQSLEEQQQQLQKDSDYVLYQLNELAEARLENPHEQTELEQELDRLNNAEAIKKSLLESIFSIEEGDMSIIQQLGTVRQSINYIARYGQDFEELLQRIESIGIELSDISSELGNIESDIQIDPERAQEINERLHIIFRLQKKHQVQSIKELMAIEADLASRNTSADRLNDEIKQLQQNIAQQKKELTALSQKISANRRLQFPILENQVHQLLAQVGMPKATLRVMHRQSADNQFTPTGTDEVEFLFAANKGSMPSELRKVASGGELSRLMLCIQSLLADSTALPTLIFDEIDTGISGEVALKVGIMIQKLAAAHQVICITHLPQIASKGDCHYFVYKDDTRDRTISRMRRLSGQERIVEIAKMLSGDNPGQMALANASELLAID